MARGMSLEEFKDALSSDATRERDELQKKLDHLKRSSSEQINDLTNELEDYKEYTRILSNRCFVQTQGMLCANCSVPEDACKHAMTTADYKAVQEYIVQNHLKTDSAEAFEAVAHFMQKRKMNQHK